jgi:hypothetical protein
MLRPAAAGRSVALLILEKVQELTVLTVSVKKALNQMRKHLLSFQDFRFPRGFPSGGIQ